MDFLADGVTAVRSDASIEYAVLLKHRRRSSEPYRNIAVVDYTPIDTSPVQSWNDLTPAIESLARQELL